MLDVVVVVAIKSRRLSRNLNEQTRSSPERIHSNLGPHTPTSAGGAAEAVEAARAAKGNNITIIFGLPEVIVGFLPHFSRSRSSRRPSNGPARRYQFNSHVHLCACCLAPTVDCAPA